MIHFRSGGRSRRPGGPSLPVFLTAYLLFCFAGVCVVVMIPGAGSPILASRMVLLFMAVTALVLFFVPLLAVQTGRATRDLARTGMISPDGRRIGKMVFVRLAQPLKATIIFSLTPCLVLLIATTFSGSMPAANLFHATGVILAAAVCSLAAGFYCSIVVENVFSAAGMALILTALICTEPVWIGPVIRSVTDASWMIQPSLLANPFVGVASALDFDVFRIDPFYHVCPIGQLRFTYPAWHSVALFFLLVSTCLLWRSGAGIRRLAMPSS